MRGSELTGRKIGSLLVEHRRGSNARGDALWQCLCDCGGSCVVKTNRLTSGTTTSCGCKKRGPHRSTLDGQRFGRLTVVRVLSIDKWRRGHYECRCDCGENTIVPDRALVTGVSKSCGCLKVEVDSSRVGANHPSFKPYLTDEDRQQRRFIEGYKEWALEVKVQSHFLCSICGQSPSGKLTSHHLASYHANPDLRLDVKNGVCLCQYHHSKFHRLYGYLHNTPLEFACFAQHERDQRSPTPVTVAKRLSERGKKLTLQQVREIRTRSGEKGVELAREYNVCPQLISRIRKDKCWKD